MNHTTDRNTHSRKRAIRQKMRMIFATTTSQVLSYNNRLFSRFYISNVCYWQNRVSIVEQLFFCVVPSLSSFRDETAGLGQEQAERAVSSFFQQVFKNLDTTTGSMVHIPPCIVVPTHPSHLYDVLCGLHHTFPIRRRVEKVH